MLTDFLWLSFKRIGIIKGDLEGVFKDFFERGMLNRSVIESFVCLIPKKGNANRLKEFQPINLITSVYKILAKVFANCLRKVLPSTIFETQGPFCLEDIGRRIWRVLY